MKRFLVLEDEPLIAMDLKHAFEDVGASAVMAATSEQAMEAIDENRFSGAILDVNLGRGETCARAAGRLKKLGIPFVLHTGDLDRSGEFLRDLEAPVLAKPQAADDVVSYLMGLL
ncbi:response regulator [Tsuneonella deserti]|uniref:Response regulator n=1 Tax=Tsuneonella deserti TaxID=2035528 RepID=A0ABQ1S7F5_9SPHN|nr:response regulator [Tsuneonella deserti]GGD93563.1 response regulator [Tsuneonella deserti]